MADQDNLFGIKDYRPDKTLRNTKDPLAYEVRKIQMAIRAVDRELYKFPSKINIANYLELLTVHTAKIKELKKSGYFVKKGIEDDEETVADEISISEGEEGVSEATASSVDSRVSAHDTFA